VPADRPETSGAGRRRTPLKWLVGAGAVCLVVASVTLALNYSGDHQLTPFNIAVPTFRVPNLDRGSPPIALANWRGKPIVLNLWGSWCPPCEAEMPALEAAHRQLGNRVVFVGIDEYDQKDAALSFLHKVGTTYAIGFDPSGQVAAMFGSPGTPTTVFISKEGREIDYHQGPFTEGDLLNDVNQLFGID